MSERRACRVIDADRKSVRYQSRRPPEMALRARLRELANERRRFGYRRLHILLRREGEPSGINRVYRLYREEGLGHGAGRSAHGVAGGRFTAPRMATGKAGSGRRRRMTAPHHDGLGACRRRPDLRHRLHAFI